MRDRMGYEVVFVVYDRRKQTPNGIGWYRVATFRNQENADRFVSENKNEDLYVSCQTATVEDLRSARD